MIEHDRKKADGTAFPLVSLVKGRATAKQYWYVAGPAVIALVVALYYDIAVLGPKVSEVVTTTTSLVTGQTETTRGIEVAYGPREASLAVALLFVVPFTVMLIKRVHDIGYPGYFAVTAVFLAFFLSHALWLPVHLLAQISLAAALVFAALSGIPAALVSALAMIVLIAWGFTPSEPGPNEYGPNPQEEN